MNIAYIQCDLRYNPFLMKKIGDKTLIETTIDKTYMLRNVEKIVAGIYRCKENRELIELLKTNDRIEIVESDTENVMSRFIEVVSDYDAEYIVRIGADLCLIDVRVTNEIIEGMMKEGADWFYIKADRGLLPDIVKLSCLKKYRQEILKEEKYFYAFLKIPDYAIKRYLVNIDLFPLNVRANNVIRFNICKTAIENNISLEILRNNMFSKLFHDTNYLVASGILTSWMFIGKGRVPFQDESGDINPWLTMAAVEFIKGRISKDMDIFEWGSGYSSLFWSKYGRSVTSCEHDKKWYDIVKMWQKDNMKLLYKELEYGGMYSKTILEDEMKYDLILIDGRDRINCAHNAVQRLKEDGIIIWDDSGRERYSEGFAFLKELGFRQITFKGIDYGYIESSSTTIFYRNNNIFGI